MERLFRSEMESVKVDPSPGLWRKVRARLIWNEFLHFNVRSVNIYYLGATVVLAGLSLFALLQKDTEVPVNGQEEINQLYEVPSPGTEVPAEKARISDQEDRQEKTGTRLQRKQRPQRDEKMESAGEQTESGETSIQSLEQTNEIHEQVEENAEVRPEGSKKSENKLYVNADFTASILEGCSPLAVEFRNTSENIESHTWLFGDGGGSDLMDPSYVFDEPGEYPVLLKVTGTDGLEYSVLKTIRVFESPKAQFEIDGESQAEGIRPVYFYNYSRGADFYQWEFGDGQISELEEPMHYYENPGRYDVKLKVWTANQCYDSMTVSNAFTGPLSEINFPTAFTPNMSGPTGGYYDINDISNNVFHPVVTGELIEYQLKIFNRQGLQIFESNDVSFGWDGYYQETLAAQGVYIWKARGKFSNGQTFVRSGDVTLIRQY